MIEGPIDRKEKKQLGRKSPHPVEFQIMVARKVRSGAMTFREASKAFGISGGCVNSWIRKHEKGTMPIPKPHKESDATVIGRMESHIKELKGEIAELYLQNLMLKKAMKLVLEKKSAGSSVITSENLEAYRGAAE